MRAWINDWREELLAAMALSLGRALFMVAIGWKRADEAMLAAIVAAVTAPGPRDWSRGHLLEARRRRRWGQVLGAVMPGVRSPQVLGHGVDRSGEWAELRVRPGTTVADLEKRAEALAAALAVAEIRVRRHASNAAIGYIHALRLDPLAGPAMPWPWAEVPWTSLWHPIPVGVDEDGEVVRLGLVEHNVLVGGEPGAGKSVAICQLIAAAALDRTAQLWLLDGKLVELAAWRELACGFAGPDVFEATALLRRVQAMMDARYGELLEAGWRKVPLGTAIHLVVIDELALYLAWPDKKARDAFADVLRDLVARGRAAGIVVIAATQKPSSDVVPTSLRDLFGYRWALRCTTAAASDTVLGSGWATNGISAAAISPAARGVGWLLHESGTPHRLRAFCLDDAAVRDVVARALTLRRGGGWDG